MRFQREISVLKFLCLSEDGALVSLRKNVGRVEILHSSSSRGVLAVFFGKTLRVAGYDPKRNMGLAFDL